MSGDSTAAQQDLNQHGVTRMWEWKMFISLSYFFQKDVNTFHFNWKSLEVMCGTVQYVIGVLIEHIVGKIFLRVLTLLWSISSLWFAFVFFLFFFKLMMETKLTLSRSLLWLNIWLSALPAPDNPLLPALKRRSLSFHLWFFHLNPFSLMSQSQESIGPE